MYQELEKAKKNKNQFPANSVAQKKSNGKHGLGLADNRPKAANQLNNMASNHGIIQRYVVGDGGSKTSEHGRVQWRDRQDLLASPDLVRNANQQLKSSGGHGSLITLGTGVSENVNGHVMKAVTPQFDQEGYNRRNATARGIGFHQVMHGPNQAGAARQQTTSEADSQQLLEAFAANPTEETQNNFTEHMQAHGITEGQVTVGDDVVAPSVSPDGRIALPADCRRAAEAITGTQTGIGYDERRVNVATGEGHELRGTSPLAVPGVHVEGETTTHNLSKQVYVSSMQPFLMGNDAANAMDAAVFDTARFLELVGDAEHPLQHLHERPDFAWKAYTALTALGKQQFAEFAHINESAVPNVGDSYTTVTEYRMPEFRNIRTRGEDGNELEDGAEIEAWTFHWGGVIMKDGGDIVTLENYAAGGEQTTNRNWQFDMYGTQIPAQTFHARHMASDLHGTVGTTLHVENMHTPRELRGFMASLANLQRLVGTAAFNAARLAAIDVRDGLNDTYGGAANPAPAAHHAAVYAQGVQEITNLVHVDNYLRQVNLLSPLVGQAGYTAQLALVTAAYANVSEDNRALTRESRLRQNAVVSLQTQVVSYRDGVETLEGLVGQGGFAHQRILIQGALSAIPNANQGVVAAHVAREAAAITLNNQIRDYRAAVVVLEGLIGQDNFNEQYLAARALRLAIPAASRGLVADYRARAQAARELNNVEL